MSNFVQTAARDEKGFTLVELAVVMIIVGLLIGGILKGQEMIANAQVTSTVAQLKAIDAATSTFRDQFSALPGDMAAANNRLQNCAAAPCFLAGANGDGDLEVNVGAAPVLGAEDVAFFNQLRAADLITGFDGTNTLQFGNALPVADVGGGFTVGSAGVGVTSFTQAEVGAIGNFIVLTGAPAAVAAGQGTLDASEAARIDNKIDDGAPATGSVVSDSANANCRNAALYNEAAAQSLCVLAVRIQG